MRRLLALVTLVAAFIGLTAAPAFAHAVLEGTEPGAGATVKQSPKQITLSYSEAVEASLGAVRVYDSRANQVDVGDAHHPNGKASVVAVDTPKLDDGLYVVTWRVLSADSHPIQGAYTFTVGSSNTTAKDAQSLANRLLTDEGGSSIVGIIFAIARFGAFLGLTLLIGGAAFLAWVWRRGRSDRRARRLVWTGWGSAVGFTLLAFALEGPYGGALGLEKVVDPSIWSDVFATRYGRVLIGRVVLLLIAIPLLMRLLPKRGPEIEHPLPSWWPWAAGVLGLALSMTPGLAGHASSGPLVPIAIPADALHIYGVGLWLGGLVLLFAAFMPRSDEASLREVVPRYSAYALVSMGVIVVTGTFQAFRQIDRFGALLDTDYGRILLVKLGIFLLLMVAAAVSRDVVNRRWRIPEDELDPRVPVGVGAGAVPATAAMSTAASGGGTTTLTPPAPGGGGDDGLPSDPEGEDDDDEGYPEGYVLDEPTAERRLRRGLLMEVVLGVIILAVTALLVNAAPARDLNSGPYLATLRTDKVSFDVTVTPAKRGANEMHLFTLDPKGTGTTVDATEVSAEMSQPSNDIAPIEVKLIRLAPGHYTSAGFTVPFAGDWKLTVKAVLGDVDEASATTTVPIHS
jgi:copper transport protein